MAAAGVSRAAGLLRSLFDRHLLLTNVGISIALSGLGDALQQRHKHRAQPHQRWWDRGRTARMATSGATVGLLCHHWYLFLDARLPGRRAVDVVRKVAVDQILFSPVCILVFFATLGALERAGPRRIVEESLAKGWKLYLAEWLVWPPAQAINFYVLPTRFRVFYDNAVSLGYDWYSSYIKNDTS